MEKYFLCLDHGDVYVATDKGTYRWSAHFCGTGDGMDIWEDVTSYWSLEELEDFDMAFRGISKEEALEYTKIEFVMPVCKPPAKCPVCKELMTQKEADGEFGDLCEVCYGEEG